MPRKAPVEDPPVEDAPAEPYHLEPVNEDIRSRLMVWGNSTQLTIQQLERVAPEWAKFLNDIFQTVGGLMETRE